ncbi:hypothetical protein SFRURICE_011527, partial [Spodoptera frugiperda]
MPTSAVYQPTTVTYEQQPTDQRWNCPISYFSRRMASSWNRAVCLRVGLCLTGSILFIIGTVLIIVGGVKFSNAAEPDPHSFENGVGELVAGSISTYSSRWGNGKEAPASGAAALTALNPSTDPLVAAQYAPVRDAPPAPDDEMRNLMDNKD